MKTIQLGDDQLYAVEPPKWRYVLIVIIGIIVGMYYGTTFLGLMMVALGYYMRSALQISTMGLGSLTMLILVIIVLLLLRKRFQQMFSYILVFLIAMLVGIAIATALILSGYDIHPPITLSDPFAQGNNTTANQNPYPIGGNSTASIIGQHTSYNSTLSLTVLPLFALARNKSKDTLNQVAKEIKNPDLTKLQLAGLLALGTLLIGITASILSGTITSFLKQFVDVNNPLFLTMMFILLIFGIYIFRLGIKV